MKTLTELETNWSDTKAKLKQRFAILTDDDFLVVDGKKDGMFGRLQTKLGKTKQEIHDLIYGA